MKATGNQPPFLMYGNVKPKLAYDALEMKRFVDKFGLKKYQMNPHFPFNSLNIQRAMVAADMDGQIDAFITAGEQLVWEDGINIEDPVAFAKDFRIRDLMATVYWKKRKIQRSNRN